MVNRKYRLALILAALVSGAFLAAGWVVGLGTHLTTVVGALVGLYTIYCGSNVTQKAVTKKNEK